MYKSLFFKTKGSMSCVYVLVDYSVLIINLFNYN
nr:MAG TPA: hypothetical protein [Caudoviricetes sp.]